MINNYHRFLVVGVIRLPQNPLSVVLEGLGLDVHIPTYLHRVCVFADLHDGLLGHAFDRLELKCKILVRNEEQEGGMYIILIIVFNIFRSNKKIIIFLCYTKQFFLFVAFLSHTHRSTIYRVLFLFLKAIFFFKKIIFQKWIKQSELFVYLYLKSFDYELEQI